MMCRSENVTCDSRLVTRSSFLSSDEGRATRYGFTLMEGMAAVTLLAFIGVSAWLVIDRCMMSAADTAQRFRAFEIARDNMEKLLGSASVTESTEYGVSEVYPDIRWQTAIEVFDLQVNTGMWARAVCSSEYVDSLGETKTIELTNWLTGLTKEQMQELAERDELKKQILAEHIIETEDLAAEYAGVNVETIRQWVADGMPVTEIGEYLKPWLDLYLQTNGNPTQEQKQSVLDEYPVLASASRGQAAPEEELDSELEELIDQGDEEELPEDFNFPDEL